MSRSYKKSPVVKDRNNKTAKRLASKTVRRSSNVTSGGYYKKEYCSWNISDWRFRGSSYTAEQFRRMWFDLNNSDIDWARRRFTNWKTAYRYWLSCYRTK